MEDNLIAIEIQIEDLQMIDEYKSKGKLHKDFLPFPTYDLVQRGYPKPNHGGMVVRPWGGSDENDNLLPSNGMWCKVEDVIKHAEESAVEFLEWSLINGWRKLDDLWEFSNGDQHLTSTELYERFVDSGTQTSKINY